MNLFSFLTLATLQSGFEPLPPPCIPSDGLHFRTIREVAYRNYYVSLQSAQYFRDTQLPYWYSDAHRDAFLADSFRRLAAWDALDDVMLNNQFLANGGYGRHRAGSPSELDALSVQRLETLRSLIGVHAYYRGEMPEAISTIPLRPVSFSPLLDPPGSFPRE